MSYAVKEAFFSLQGEGANSGRPAVFCRFSGCNLWSGREADRTTAICGFCDTDFRGTDGEGGGSFACASDLGEHLLSLWPTASEPPFIIFTGGEPTLQLDEALLLRLHVAGAVLAVETNGTRPLPTGLDWVCVSPKAGTELRVGAGEELKLVHPQAGLDPAAFLDLRFDHFFLQPMYGPKYEESLAACVAYCLANPRWRLSLQTHRALGLR